MKSKEALLYARTIRHLRAVQLLGRAKRVLPAGGVDRRPAPLRRPCEALARPALREPVLVGPTRARMLGEEGELLTPKDWDDPDRPALWRYHANYFDDLRAGGASRRAKWNDDLIERWVDENSSARTIGWDPYPTSLRIVNWVRWGLSQGLSEAAIESLAVQARTLRANLEWHILGNHLLANAKALVFAGTFFRGEEAEAWHRKGMSLVRRELAEQVLADGGHFERSPMYHSLVLEDVLDLVALVRAAPKAFDRPDEVEASLGSIADRMGAWLVAMTHPDRDIALFNDAAFGQAPSPAALAEYARRLGRTAPEPPAERLTSLEASGYVRVAHGPILAILDVGEIGPKYLPGHAHADTLSFEVSFDGRRVITNGGTSVYEQGDERLRQRSTAAHSTVEIDGESSSEIWSSFRVARRAEPLDLRIEDGAAGLSVACSHDGYKRLPGKVIHRRTWRFADRSIDVEDTLTGRFDSAIARLHLHPDFDASLGEQGAVVAHERRTAFDVRVDGGQLTSERGTWHPGFGRSLPNDQLLYRIDPAEPRATCHIAW
ncbi:MAG: alginate lyase family protein [Planctomycetota bacterium]